MNDIMYIFLDKVVFLASFTFGFILKENFTF